MKINFIRQISDDILKENHDLKSNIILVKQQLQNFQDSMTAFIRQSQVQIPIMATSHQTLSLFIKTVSSKLADYQMQITRYEINNKALKQNSEQVQLKNQQLKKYLANNSNRQSKWKEQYNGLQKKYFDLVKNHSQFQIRQQSLKQEVRSINQKNQIQKNIQEEIKKKQIESAKLASHNQLREVRDRIEDQNLELEKKYKSQIEEKDKRIKQLEKIMEKLASELKLDSSQTTVLTTVLQAFQQSHKYRKLIDQYKQQNAQLRKNTKYIEKQKIQTQSSLMQRNIELHNLQSQFQKLKIDKLEFQRNLGTKIKQMQKAQKDKQAMQQYYDRKWSSDYNKVKTQLQKAFLQKSQEIQKIFAKRIKEFEVKMIESLQRINIYEHKNKQLERIHSLDCNQKQNLRKEIQKLIKQKQNLSSQIREVQTMSRQQIDSIKFVKLQEQLLDKQQIRKLTEKLKKRQNNIKAQADRIKAIVADLNDKNLISMKIQLENQQKVFQVSKLQIKNSYEARIKSLRQEVYQFQNKTQKVKERLKQQFQKLIEQINQRHQKMIKQKEQQSIKKVQRTVHKLRECQNKLASNKKHYQEMFQAIDRQKNTLQKQMESLKNKLKNSQNQLKMGNSQRKQFQEINKQIKKKIEILQAYIKTKNREMQELKVDIKKAKDTASQLTNKRSSWVNELQCVQNSFKRQFNEMKDNFEKQIKFYKSKIWQLQKQYKNQPISKKNYQRILSLHSEKEELKNALDIKEAENIVLSQVKELYETQLQKNQVKINNNQLKSPKPIFRRKLDMQRKFTQVGHETLRSDVNESSDMMKMKKYIKQSYKKQQYLSLTRARYNQMPGLQRVKTTQI